MGELSPDEIEDLKSADCTCAALTYWKAKAEMLYRALSGIPHTCDHHPHLHCAACTAQTVLQGEAK